MCPAEYAPADREKRPDSEHRTHPAVVAPRPRSTAPPLVVGAADDHAEREADRVADEVISRLQGDHPHEVAATATAPAVHRSAVTADADVEVGRDGGPLSDGLSSRIDRRRGAGTALPGPVRQRMEAGFGRSLAGVRIHHDTEAARLNRSVAARAFTTGNDIFFGAGEYQPDTPAGERVLAHELAHTQQQGSGPRRTTIRRWDIKAPNVGWRRARHLRTLESRRVWFVADQAGEEIVVKPEDQPVGLGDLVAAMQKRVTKVKSVKQRKLGDDDKNWVSALIAREVATGERSWLRRGDFLGQRQDPKVTDFFEKLQLAEQDAHGALTNQSNNLVAMTLASGETASDVAASSSSGASGLRDVLDRPGHLRKLGVLTAVDLFLGNADRVLSRTLGNWFYDPDSAITLIDQVDSTGSNMVKGFKNPLDANNAVTWHTQNDLANGQLAATAKYCVTGLTSEAKYLANDQGITEWLKEEANGVSRKDRFEAEFLQGLKDGKKRIAKIFKTTRKDVFSRSTRKVKKRLKAAAGAAGQLDTGDAQYANGAPNYYDILKQRAAWVAKN